MMNRSVLLLLAALAGCSAPPPPITTCEALGSLEPICGFQNPEDLELLPDGRTLAVSEMGDVHGTRSGRLLLFDTLSGQRQQIDLDAGSREPGWGAAACPGPPPPLYSPHGIHLQRRADDRLQLLVIGHGAEERVDYLELSAGSQGWRARWRGCVPVPEPLFLNDVVADGAGGFYATHMHRRGGARVAGIDLAVVPGLFGQNTGHVVHWSEGAFRPVAYSAGAFPNGLQRSADGRYLYVAYWLGNELRRIDLTGREPNFAVRVQHPDNAQWDARGRLLVASHRSSVRGIMPCFEIRRGACPVRFTIERLDPATMRTTTVLDHQGPPLGGATVAQQIGDTLYLGSFAADRLARAPYSESRSGRRPTP